MECWIDWLVASGQVIECDSLIQMEQKTFPKMRSVSDHHQAGDIELSAAGHHYEYGCNRRCARLQGSEARTLGKVVIHRS